MRVLLWVAVSSDAQAKSDKESLPDQERSLRAVADARGWNVIDVLTVPGHSRVYFTWDEFAAAAAREGIDAGKRMQAHWQARDFDVVLCRDAKRYGREQSILAEFIGRTIAAGAEIYMTHGERVHAGNYRMVSAMAGYAAASEIDEFVRRSSVAKEANMRRGLVGQGKPPFSHRIVRNPSNGKAERLEVREELRPLFDAVYELFVQQRVGYNHIGKRLAQHYPHLPAAMGLTAQEWHDYTKRKKWDSWLHTPAVWGHMAKGYLGYKTKSGAYKVRNFQPWVYDVFAPVPDGTLVERHVVPAVYTGAQASAMIAEMNARLGRGGRAYVGNNYRFAGLFACARCGSSMTTIVWEGARRGLKCRLSRRDATRCDNRATVKHADLQEFMERFLRARMQGVSPAAFGARRDDAEQVARLTAAIDENERKMLVLMDELATVQEAARAFIRARVDELAGTIQQQRAALEHLHANIATARAEIEHDAAVSAELTELDLERFWSLPDPQINGFLKRILRGRKFYLDGNNVVKFE